MLHFLDSLHLPEQRNFYTKEFHDKHDKNHDGKLDLVSKLSCNKLSMRADYGVGVFIETEFPALKNFTFVCVQTLILVCIQCKCLIKFIFLRTIIKILIRRSSYRIYLWKELQIEPWENFHRLRWPPWWYEAERILQPRFDFHPFNLQFIYTDIFHGNKNKRFLLFLSIYILLTEITITKSSSSQLPYPPFSW